MGRCSSGLYILPSGWPASGTRAHLTTKPHQHGRIPELGPIAKRLNGLYWSVVDLNQVDLDILAAPRADQVLQVGTLG